MTLLEFVTVKFNICSTFYLVRIEQNEIVIHVTLEQNIYAVFRLKHKNRKCLLHINKFGS